MSDAPRDPHPFGSARGGSDGEPSVSAEPAAGSPADESPAIDSPATEGPATGAPAQGRGTPPDVAPDASAPGGGQPTLRLNPDEPPGGAATDDPLVGRLLRGKWRVLERLGAGSYGTVYRVEDVDGGWIEALKILAVDRLAGGEADTVRQRFLREARIMKRLGAESRHIVGLSTYEEDLEAGLVYFLMEYVEGRSLAEVLAQQGPLAPEAVVRIALHICDALIVAHEDPEEVVHRDLKLENVMLTVDRSGEEIAKVLDFGIAKVAGREADSRLTMAGTLGTPGYAAPEQLRAEAVDARTDLFALGVILYALLTGRDPWLGRPAGAPTQQVYELMVATERARMLPLASAAPEGGAAIPQGLVDVVTRLLQRDPAHRFPSARELQDALTKIAVEKPTGRGRRAQATADPRSALSAGVAPRAASRVAPRGRARRLSAAVVVALLVGTSLWLRPWGRTLQPEELRERAEEGGVATARLSSRGIEGRLRLAPLPDVPLPAPFVARLAPPALPSAVEELRVAGVAVDTSWEVARLLGLAAEAQARLRYFGHDGEDVLAWAERARALEPDRPEVRSLLLKVGERMAWDADAALADGAPERARELLGECLAVAPDHPRCGEVAGEMEGRGASGPGPAVR